MINELERVMFVMGILFCYLNFIALRSSKLCNDISLIIYNYRIARTCPII